MGTTTLLRIIIASTLAMISQVGDLSSVYKTSILDKNTSLQAEDTTFAASAKLTCKTGFKPGKTPISLVPGAKVSCVNTTLATTGKKLLTGFTNTCGVCHASTGPNPVSKTNTNLRTQGFTLKPADIKKAFILHQAEMSGSVLGPKDPAAISAYLQTIK